MSKLKDYKDNCFLHWQGSLRVLHDEGGTPAWPVWKDCEWTGPYGTVSMTTYVMKDRDKRDEATRMEVTLEGQKFERRWEHHFGDLTLARLAREFLDEVYIKCLVKRLKIYPVQIEQIKEGLLNWSELSVTDDDLIRKYL